MDRRAHLRIAGGAAVIEPRTIAQRLGDTRLAGLPGAVVATLKPLFVGVDVRVLPGRIDISDIIAGDNFPAPMMGVTAARIRQPIGVGGSYNLPVDLVAYIVTEDMALGTRAEKREVIAYALGLGLFEILADLDMARWGLTSIGSPEDAELKPLMTAKAYAAGTAYYALAWRQTLLGFGIDPLERQPYGAIVGAVEDGVPVEYPADLGSWPT